MARRRRKEDYKQTVADYLRYKSSEPYFFAKELIKKKPGMEPIDYVIEALRKHKDMSFLEIVEHFELSGEVYENPEFRKVAQEVFEKSLVGRETVLGIIFFPKIARKLQDLFCFEEEFTEEITKKAILNVLATRHRKDLNWVVEFNENGFLTEEITSGSDILRALRICLISMMDDKVMFSHWFDSPVTQLVLEIFNLKERFNFNKFKPDSDEVKLIEDILNSENLSWEIKEELIGCVFDQSDSDLNQIRKLYESRRDEEEEKIGEYRQNSRQSLVGGFIARLRGIVRG